MLVPDASLLQDRLINSHKLGQDNRVQTQDNVSGGNIASLLIYLHPEALQQCDLSSLNLNGLDLTWINRNLYLHTHRFA